MNPYYQDDYCTIYHGDCREILPSLPKVDLVLTDPPYGTGGREGSVHLNDGAIIGNRMSADSYIWWLSKIAKGCYQQSLHGVHLYSFSDWRSYKNQQIAYESAGWELRSLIVWDKGNGMGEFWRSSHEFILFLTKQKPDKLKHGGCFNVLRFPSIKNKNHPAEKPVKLIVELLKASSSEDQTILDPFMGSGTTLRAAKDLRRKAVGIEIEEKYCEIAVQRLRQEVLSL